MAKLGRPTKFDPSYIDLAYTVICVMGCTNEELAQIIGVAPSTVQLWLIKHKNFSEAIIAAKDKYDSIRVEQALRERAIGYSHKDIDIRVVNGEIVETPIIKHYPPETPAIKMWLNNRNPNRWKDKQEIQHSGVTAVVNMTTDEYKKARKEMLEQDDC